MTILHFLVGLIGVILVLTVVLDILLTTLRLNGSGIFSVRITNRLWFLVLYSRTITTNHRLLSLLGFSIVLFSMLLWLFLLWIGWVLIFSAHESAVISAQTQLPADFWSRVYFVGYSLVSAPAASSAPPGIAPCHRLFSRCSRTVPCHGLHPR
jgi:hypothetical protein